MVLNARGVPDLTRIDNVTASEVLLPLVKSDESSGLLLFPPLNLFFTALGPRLKRHKTSNSAAEAFLQEVLTGTEPQFLSEQWLKVVATSIYI